MRNKLNELASGKRNIMVNFAAANGSKLVSQAGVVDEVGDDYLMLKDLYGNLLLVPFANIAFIEIRK